MDRAHRALLGSGRGRPPAGPALPVLAPFAAAGGPVALDGAQFLKALQTNKGQRSRVLGLLTDRPAPISPDRCGKNMAEAVGFEPTGPAKAQRFSRPPHSTTLPNLRFVRPSLLPAILEQAFREKPPIAALMAFLDLRHPLPSAKNRDVPLRFPAPVAQPSDSQGPVPRQVRRGTPRPKRAVEARRGKGARIPQITDRARQPGRGDIRQGAADATGQAGMQGAL